LTKKGGTAEVSLPPLEGREAFLVLSVIKEGKKEKIKEDNNMSTMSWRWPCGAEKKN